MRSFVALLLISVGAGCSVSSPIEEFGVEFSVVDDEGAPLHGIRVHVGQTHVGSTGAEGRVRSVLRGRVGSRFPLRWECPKPSEMLGTKEVTMRSQSDIRKRAKKIHIELRCRRASRVLAVVIDSGGIPGLPVMVNGIERARTSSRGYAHLQVVEPPGTIFQLRLDTTGREKMKPVSPTRVLRVEKHDEIATVREHFVVDVPTPARRPRGRRRRHRKTKKVSRPVRID